MAALARVVHDCQGAACAEHDHREVNQQGGLRDYVRKSFGGRVERLVQLLELALA